MEISLNTFAQRNLPDDSPLHSYNRHNDPRMLCIFLRTFLFPLSYIFHTLYTSCFFSFILNKTLFNQRAFN